MAVAYTGDLPLGTKPCVVCAEPINAAATKCIHCQSEQGILRRRVGMSSTVLSLLVALVSVTGVVVPSLIKLLSVSDSDLHFTIAGTATNTIFALVSNDGPMTGAAGMLQLIVNGGRLNIFLTPPNDIPVLVEPGKAVLIKFHWDKRGPSVIPMEGECSLRLYGAGPASEQSRRRTVPCKVIDSFLN